MADNKVKGGTVVYVDGRTVGVNTSGEKVGGTGPDKDRLKADVILNLRASTIRARGPDGTVEPGNAAVSTIRPGDKISAGWVPSTQGNLPTSVTIERSGPAFPTGQTLTLNPGGPTPQEQIASGRVHAPAGPLGSEHGPQAIQTGISHPELNYVNTTQQVGEGGPAGERLDPTTPDGTPDATEKIGRMSQQAEGEPAKGTKGRATPVADTGTKDEDLESYTVPQLKQLAADEGVEVHSDDHKADIVKKIGRARGKK